jgi:hypothetical protein
MRRIRPYLIGLVGGALLMVGGQALADIPDPGPSAPDPAHIFYVCVRNGTVPQHPMEALDKSQGTGQCNSGWTEKRLVPSIPPTTAP